MVYVTGDIHGDYSRFSSSGVRRLKKGDTLLVCGDFGFLWNGGHKEQQLLKKLGTRPYTIAFLDGRHENYSLLATYPVSEWNGGHVQVIAGSLLHLMRGEIYEIEGESFFTFGGGESADHEFRTEGVGWWEEEMPSVGEMTDGVAHLKARGFQVDYVLTHEPSGKASGYLGSGKAPLNGVRIYLDRLEESVTCKRWYFGCLHLDKTISNRHRAVFQEIVPVHSEEPQRRR
ncbi:MAG: hypothetical protein HFJ80_00235 [Clostridiales bacterium]|nr:hypothetical protein [Clostridiales bacterium]